MGHPHIDNGTLFAFEPLFVADEEMRPALVSLIKATYSFDLNGDVRLADEQLPINLAGEFSTDAPISSYKYEPETALCKLSTDVTLIGHARPPQPGTTAMDVGIRVGPVQKVARVFGDRYWVRTKDGVGITATAPLGRIPLIWENAFGGGRDGNGASADRPQLEPRNPVGTGFGTPLEKDGDRFRLPNIENPHQLIEQYGEVATPWGFGFVSPNWQPRAGFAGTYDENWSSTRKPMLPRDFDRRFFNAGAPGLVAPGYLRGDEDVIVLNATAESRVSFRLPGVPPPRCRIVLRGQQDTQLETHLDTVIVNCDERQLILIWRAHALIGQGPHDVSAIEITSTD